MRAVAGGGGSPFCEAQKNKFSSLDQLTGGTGVSLRGMTVMSCAPFSDSNVN